jgi:hypothetical protein
MFAPTERNFPPPPACTSSRKGDLNGDTLYTPTDVVLMLNCVFLATGSCCDTAIADVNCDGSMTPTDLVAELRWVTESVTLPCFVPPLRVPPQGGAGRLEGEGSEWRHFRRDIWIEDWFQGRREWDDFR